MVRVAKIRPLSASSRPMTDEERDRCAMHLGLVYKLVHKFARKYPGIEEDEFLQEASLALTRAIKVYDPSRGFTFSTFATKVIFGACIEVVVSGGVIRIPRGAYRDTIRDGTKPPRAVSFDDIDAREPAASSRDDDPGSRAETEDQVAAWLHGLNPKEEFLVRGCILDGRPIKGPRGLAREYGRDSSLLYPAYAAAIRFLRNRAADPAFRVLAGGRKLDPSLVPEPAP